MSTESTWTSSRKPRRFLPHHHQPRETIPHTGRENNCRYILSAPRRLEVALTMTSLLHLLRSRLLRGDGVVPVPPGRASRSSVPPAAARPELYVYDHCPFCVRVLWHWREGHRPQDCLHGATTTSRRQRRWWARRSRPFGSTATAPWPNRLTSSPRWTPKTRLAPAPGRTDLKAWQKSVQTLMRKPQRPRYVMVPLPEFMKKRPRCLRRQPPDAAV